MTDSATMSPQLRYAALAVAVTIHLVVLYLPQAPDPGGPTIPGLDKLAHVAVFALVVAAALWAGLAAAWVVPVALAHAVVSEAVQHQWLAGRSGDGWDVVADVVGVLLGWAVVARLRRGSPAPSGRGR